MRGTFGKLLVSFWLTVILGGIMSGIVISAFHHLSMEHMRDDMVQKMDNKMATVIVHAGETAERLYSNSGRQEYEKYLVKLASTVGVDVNLATTDLHTLSGPPLPPDLIDVGRHALEKDSLVIHKIQRTLFVAKPLYTETGQTLLITGIFKIGPPPSILPPGDHNAIFQPVDVLRALIMFLLVFAVCIYLARSLTGPIKKLRQTTRRIGAGDYSARVGDSLDTSSRELVELGLDFDHMVNRTEQLILSQQRLLRDISHELRSPLARLNVALELAKKKFRAGDDTTLHKIGKESDRLNELIGQLLFLTRLESSAETFDFSSPVNLGKLLVEIVNDADFEARSLKKKVIIDDGPATMIVGSTELLRRIFENIIRNGVNFAATEGEVRVKLSNLGGHAVITVSDSGPGVNENDLPHLFEPFYRAEKGRERKTGGTGIGLAIVHHAVKAHGGDVTAANRRNGNGLVVTVRLPLPASEP